MEAVYAGRGTGVILLTERLVIFWENAYKKGAGRMLRTLPRQVRRMRVPLMLRGYATCFKPSPGASRTGAFVLAYSRDEARSIRQRSVSSAKSTRRLMRPTSSTRKREFAPCRARRRKPRNGDWFIMRKEGRQEKRYGFYPLYLEAVLFINL